MMSNYKGTIGKIKGFHTKSNILWNIPNFFSLPSKADTSFESPRFSFLGSTWYFTIFPNVANSKTSGSFFGLNFNKTEDCYSTCCDNDPPHICFDVGIKCGNKLECQQSYCDYFKDSPVEWHKLIERDVLLGNKDKFAPGGILTIKFIGNTLPHLKSTATQTISGIINLSRDFQNLLHSKEKSDVVIKIQDQTFQVHRQMLEARSSVFASMFEHDMKEKNSGIVNIIDCEPDTFENFLSFLYTGKIENLDSGNAIDVYSLSHKYDVSSLKEMCRDFMKENLCPEKVCDILVLADTFDESELKISAREYIINNMKLVMPTESWMQFIHDYPEMATEIVVTATATMKV